MAGASADGPHGGHRGQIVEVDHKIAIRKHQIESTRDPTDLCRTKTRQACWNPSFWHEYRHFRLGTSGDVSQINGPSIASAKSHLALPQCKVLYGILKPTVGRLMFLDSHITNLDALTTAHNYVRARNASCKLQRMFQNKPKHWSFTLLNSVAS